MPRAWAQTSQLQHILFHRDIARGETLVSNTYKPATYMVQVLDWSPSVIYYQCPGTETLHAHH